MSLKIRIERHSTHPHFGGSEIESWDYEMRDGEKARMHFEKLRAEQREANSYCVAYINIVHTPEN